MADSAAYFAAKSVGLSRCGGRKPSTLNQAARHNLREIQAELGARSHIDPDRTSQNLLIHGPRTAAGVQTMADQLLTDNGIDVKRLRRDHCQAIEIIFSVAPGALRDPIDYFHRCTDWIGSAMNLPIVSGVIHFDEAAPHAHVLLLPVSKGKHLGSSPIGAAALRDLRERFFTAVAGPAGLKRMGAKLAGNLKRQAVRAVIDRCERMGLPRSMGVLWPDYRSAIERDPTYAVIALGICSDDLRNPIGFAQSHEKDRSLSCVGFANQMPVRSLAELWERVGCKAPVIVRQRGQKGIRSVIETEGLSAHA